MRAAKLGVSAIAVGALVLGGAPAFAATIPSAAVSGAVKVFVTPGQGAGGTIIIAGAIGDYGKTLNINKNGTADPNGNYAKVTLQRGTFEVNKTALNTKMANAQPTINNMKTCSAVVSGTAPVTLLAGTGLYSGITGTVSVTITQVFVLPSYASGTHKGQCNESNNAQPVASFESVTGTGTVPTPRRSWRAWAAASSHCAHALVSSGGTRRGSGSAAAAPTECCSSGRRASMV